MFYNQVIPRNELFLFEGWKLHSTHDDHIDSLCLSQCSTVIRKHSFCTMLFFIVMQDKFKMYVFAWVCCSEGLSSQYSKAGHICEERSKNVKGFLKYLILFLKWLNSNLLCCFAHHSLKKSQREISGFFFPDLLLVFSLVLWVCFFYPWEQTVTRGQRRL